ncbi:hypothetical protein [Dactylosporangium sp. CA-233914]|uniref:hypothetical protein n=1 Tax=Dactylosporangium sp. CA-233914 TaxID=3239934 RepID=UPI003D8DEF71
MRRTLVRAGAAVLLALAGSLAAPGTAGHASPLCDRPVPPPSCGDPDPDPDPGPVDAPPLGSLDTVTFVGNGVRVTGWAADADANGPIQVHIYVDGAFVQGLTTRADRTFDGFAPSGHGAHTVCAWALNVPLAGATPAANRQIGCKSYDVPVVANIRSWYDFTGGRWMIAFDDNVAGESGFEVRWDYYVLQNIPGSSQQIAWPQSLTYTLPAHPGTGPVSLPAPKGRPDHALRLTVTAPGFGSASTTSVY